MNADPPVVEKHARIGAGRPARKGEGEQHGSQSDDEPTARDRDTRHSSRAEGTPPPLAGRAGVPEEASAYWK